MCCDWQHHNARPFSPPYERPPGRLGCGLVSYTRADRKPTDCVGFPGFWFLQFRERRGEEEPALINWPAPYEGGDRTYVSMTCSGGWCAFSSTQELAAAARPSCLAMLIGSLLRREILQRSSQLLRVRFFTRACESSNVALSSPSPD